MKKRLLAILLCASMVASLLTVGVMADDGEEPLAGTCGDNVYWSFDEETSTLTISGYGPMDDYLASYERPYHHLRDKIEKVDIGDSITHIGDFAFGWNDNLEEIELGNSIKSIGNNTIVSDKIEALAFPIGVQTIGYGIAISNNGTISVPSSVTRIGTYYEGVFADEHTEQFVYYAGAFGRCKEINVESGNDRYFSVDGVLYEKCENGKYNLICYPSGKTEESYSVIDGTQEIVMGAFSSARISQIIMPTSLKRIGMQAFFGCGSLSDVQLNAGLEKIFASAFWACISLTRLDIPASVNYFAEEYVSLNGLEGMFPQPPDLDIYFYGSAAPEVFNSGSINVHMNWSNHVSEKTYVTIHYPQSATGWSEFIEKFDDYQYTLDGEPIDLLNFEPWDPGQFPEGSSTPLELVSTYPANGENIDISANDLVMTFNYDISMNSFWQNGSIYIKDYETDEIVKEIDDIQFASNGHVSGSIMTIRYGLVGLDVGKKYYVEIDPNVIRADGMLDGEFNFFGGLEKGDWVFSTKKIEGGDEFTLGRDTFSFNNDSRPFNDAYYISDEHKAYLMDKGEIIFRLELAILCHINEAGNVFDGACFGMSSMMGLIYEDLIPLKSIQANAETTWELNEPVDNKTLASLLTYYQILQAYPGLRFTDLLQDQESLAKELINYLLTDGEPVVVQIHYSDDYDGNQYHDVLAYDIESTSEEYLIYIADPNQMKLVSGNPCIPSAVMTIWKDDYSVSSYSYTAWTGITLEIEDVQLKKIRTLDEIYNESNIEFAPEPYKSLETDAKNFTIVEQGSGRSAVIQDGVKISGDISVYGPDYLAYGNTSNDLAIYYLDVDGDISITFNDDNNQRRVYLESTSQNISAVESDGKVITFMDNGNVKISGATESSNVLLSSAGAFDACSGVIIEVDVSDVSIEKSSGRISITSASDLGLVNVKAFDKFDEINVSGSVNGNLAYITADNNGQGNEIALSSETALIDEATLTNTVVFMSNGGSFVDAQSGIVYGGKAVRPENPTKSGYVFGGWYKDEALTKPWNFSEDVVTEYTWLYAKWLDESELPDEPSYPDYPVVDKPGNRPTEEPDEPSAALPFTDVAASAWYYDAVSYVYANGLMDGVSALSFNPDGAMTRAMVWAILARIDGETVTGADWAAEAREWAVAEDVSDGTDPDGYVTREQLVTMLYRYAGEPAASGSLSGWADAARVSDWAEGAMVWAVGEGVITGASATELNPAGSATRAECAAILMRYVEL